MAAIGKNQEIKIMRFFENDRIRVKENKIPNLFYSNPRYIIEENEMKNPVSFFTNTQGVVIECDFDKRKGEWSHFVEFENRRTKEIFRFWFLESELLLI